MITGFFLSIFYSIIAFFVSLLPILPIPSDWINAFALIWTYLNQWSFLLPIPTILLVLTLATLFHVSFLIFDTGIFIYKLIRGK